MIFATFLEELEARTAIEDQLKRFARAVDRQVAEWRRINLSIRSPLL